MEPMHLSAVSESEFERRQTRLAELRRQAAVQAAARNSTEDLVALVEACYEQGMRNSEVIAELRRAEGCGLREGVWLLQSLVLKSENPAVLAVREDVQYIGQTRPYGVGDKVRQKENESWHTKALTTSGHASTSRTAKTASWTCSTSWTWS